MFLCCAAFICSPDVPFVTRRSLVSLIAASATHCTTCCAWRLNAVLCSGSKGSRIAEPRPFTLLVNWWRAKITLGLARELLMVSFSGYLLERKETSCLFLPS